MQEGRYFTHERPMLAASWDVPCIKALRERPDVMIAEADLCQFGMMSKDEEGWGHAKKPTRFMTNSVEMYKTLNRKCKGEHRHVHLIDGRAKAAEVYPKKLCRAILRGTFSRLE